MGFFDPDARPSEIPGLGCRFPCGTLQVVHFNRRTDETPIFGRAAFHTFVPLEQEGAWDGQSLPIRNAVYLVEVLKPGEGDTRYCVPIRFKGIYDRHAAMPRREIVERPPRRMTAPDLLKRKLTVEFWRDGKGFYTVIEEIEAEPSSNWPFEIVPNTPYRVRVSAVSRDQQFVYLMPCRD